jgi:hypothetical protein
MTDENALDAGIKPLTVTVRRASELTGLGATSIWGMIRRGKLEAVRPTDCRRTLVSYDSLARLLRS